MLENLEKLEKLEKLFLPDIFFQFFFPPKKPHHYVILFIMEKMEKYFIIKDVLVFNIHTHLKYSSYVCVCVKSKY